jgi:hypothetical protein
VACRHYSAPAPGPEPLTLKCVLLPQSTARVNPQTYNSIKALTEDPDTVVVIFSGSAKVRFRVHRSDTLSRSRRRSCCFQGCRDCICICRLPCALPPQQRHVNMCMLYILTCFHMCPTRRRAPTLQDQLEETFGALRVWLAAENGIFMRPPPTQFEPRPVRLLAGLFAGHAMHTARALQDTGCVPEVLAESGAMWLPFTRQAHLDSVPGVSSRTEQQGKHRSRQHLWTLGLHVMLAFAATVAQQQWLLVRLQYG